MKFFAIGLAIIFGCKLLDSIDNISNTLSKNRAQQEQIDTLRQRVKEMASTINQTSMIARAEFLQAKELNEAVQYKILKPR